MKDANDTVVDLGGVNVHNDILNDIMYIDLFNILLFSSPILTRTLSSSPSTSNLQVPISSLRRQR